jgi:uncharacterized secreted protein with C-terminal beta-propeller domain
MKISKQKALAAIPAVLAAILILTSAAAVMKGAPLLDFTDIVSDGEKMPVSRLGSVTVEHRMPGGLEPLPAVGNRETLYKLLQERGALYYGLNEWGGGGIVNAGREKMETREDAGLSFTGTEGTDGEMSEGDIVKTDGSYIYALSGDTLRIVRADGSTMSLASSIVFDDTAVLEFYLFGGRLAVIGEKTYDDLGECTVILIYDMSNRSDPKEIRRIDVNGKFVSARVVGDTVSVVMCKTVSTVYGQADSMIILPCAEDTANGGGAEPFALDRIFYLPGTSDPNYLIIGAIDAVNNGPFEPKAYLGAGNHVYMGRNAIYLARAYTDGRTFTDPGTEKTDILRFEYDGASVRYSGIVTLNGSPVNRNCMDEEKGYFRIALVEQDKGTSISILNRDMQLAGVTEPIENQIEAVLFMGGVVYAIDREETEPIVTFDLSDPENPARLGEISIPGDSQYMHMPRPGRLLVIGRNTREVIRRLADGTEVVDRIDDLGMKATLYNVEDPEEPIELNLLMLGAGRAEINSNPRAMMHVPANNMYGFFVRYEAGHQNAILMSARPNNLVLEGTLNPGVGAARDNRLCKIGGAIYLVNNRGIWVYEIMHTEFGSRLYEETGNLLF